MSSTLIPFTVLATIGLTFYGVTKLLTDYYLRKKMVEKGLVGEDASSILAKDYEQMSRYSSLKWGLIVVSAGIGFLINNVVGDFEREPSLALAILAISIGLGFLVYYFIVNGKTKS
ncbi:MAG: DUF6249 domain-containing protein [Bacteroidota bacterium]